MRNTIPWRFLASVALALTLLVAISTPAVAATYNFYCISSADQCTPNLGNQLSVTVTDEGSGKVGFKFTNIGSVASFIEAIYFDDGTLLGIASVENSIGVKFTQDSLNKVSPPDLPGGDTIIPKFDVTAGFSADADSPGTNKDGVDNYAGSDPTQAEWVKITFNLINGKTYADTINALALGGAPGGLRIGLHVQGIAPNGKSAAYVNIVPEPGFYGLLSMGLAGLYFAVVRRRKRESPSA